MKKIFNIYSKKVRNFFKQEFFKNTIVHWVLIASLFLNIICWAILLFFVSPVDFPIILHYNVYFGVDIIGDWWQIYTLPLIGTVIFVINTVLGYVFFRHGERIISYMLLLATFMAQLSALIATSSMVVINY